MSEWKHSVTSPLLSIPRTCSVSPEQLLGIFLLITVNAAPTYSCQGWPSLRNSLLTQTPHMFY